MTETDTDFDRSWAAYFGAAQNFDLLAAFDALEKLGMRPLPVGEDDKGGLKKPSGGLAWQDQAMKERRKLLQRLIKQQVPVGIGCQPDGFLVLDIDPPNKDRGNLPDAWKDSATILLGGEDWPRTMTVKTAAGCHVWFRIPPDSPILTTWQGRGKLEMPLPRGGKVEFFTGNDKAMQVACAPSEGKAVALAEPPAWLPRSLEAAVMDLLKPQPETPSVPRKETPATEEDGDWFYSKLVKLTARVMNAAVNTRHDTYRACVKTMAGYAAGMNLENRKEQVWEHLAGAHREAKPEVSDYVLLHTFNWGWDKGVATPLTPPPKLPKEPPAEEFLGDSDLMEAADVATIRALMLKREWLWGDPAKNTGWFLGRGLHLVEGKEGTGKTRWLLDLVRRWSYNLRWPDNSEIHIDSDSKILFVASDSHWDQIAMTAESFGIPDENIIFTGPKDKPYDFTSLDDPETLSLIRLWCDKYKIAMIVIDTLMAATTRPLVDPQEVAQVAGPLRQIAREKNVVIAMVGHLNSQGETWGRAIGRQCDNVIRLEADDAAPQNVSIKSVKARWNRFILPTLHGTQGENGWEYSSVGSDAGEARQIKGRLGAMELIREYLVTVSRATWGELRAEVTERGASESAVDRALKVMVQTGELVNYKEKFPSGKECTFYELNGEQSPVNESSEADL